MGFILRHQIDEIATALKQTFDDKVIQRSQIAYWILLVGNTMKAQHIQKRSSGAFLSTFPRVPVLISPTDDKNIIAGRKYFELPETIYDFNNDRAIDYISYVSDDGPFVEPHLSRVTFTRTTPKMAERLYYSRYEKPSPARPYFYRSGSSIILLGIEKIDVPTLEVGLFTALDPLTKINIDEYFDFPDELTYTLRMQVLSVAKLNYLFPQERQNDGDDAVANKPVNTPKMVSVNEQPPE